MQTIIRRCLPLLAMAVLCTFQSGCIVTDWRWIWEDDDEHTCHYEKVVMQPAGPGGPTMSVTVPADR